MMKQLNFFKMIFSKNLCLLTLFSLIIVGCSGLYEYQPPAPIYGKTPVTNPYQTDRAETTGIIADRTYQQSEINKEHVLQDKYNTNSVDRDSVFIKKPLSSASIALVAQADQLSSLGDFDSAVATIERALRIDSRNATLTYKLAQIRLKQSKPRLAEDLAKKAALLSASDTALKKQSWLLISEARKQQKNYHGAKEAKLKAEEI